jgi:chaperone required for assembly of F1-ATPase
VKRFYKTASAAPVEGGWGVHLDGRAVKTVGGRAQTVPTQALAQALAAEWDAQGDKIDTTLFLYRDMTDYTLDVVAGDPAGTAASILPYAQTDTLCYRADPDEAFWAHQCAVWEPVLTGAEARYGLRFERISGIIHRPQPEATMARVAELLASKDAFTLAALVNLSSLAASLVVALLALEPDADLDALWDAASLEETWQADLWGRDDEAEERREKRRAGFMAAARFAVLARS